MLRRVGSLFSRQRNSKKQTGESLPLTQDQKNLISMFSQNLDAMANIPQTAASGPIFAGLVDQFALTFDCVAQDHVNNSESRKILENYLRFCGTSGKYALTEDNQAVERLCISLAMGSKLLGGIPADQSFHELFWELLRHSATNSERLLGCKYFISNLFKTTSFFQEFCGHAGFVKLFGLLFFNPECDSAQKMVLNILFHVVPVDFYTAQPKESCAPTLSIVIAKLKENTSGKDANFGNACRFVAHYVALTSKREEDVVKAFKEFDGFGLLNGLFKSNSAESACECYEVLMLETGINPMVVESMFELYGSPEISSSLRSDIIEVLRVRKKNLEQTYELLTATIPLKAWITLPPRITTLGLERLGEIIKIFTDVNLVDFSDDLPVFLDLVAPPGTEDVPVSAFLGIILAGYNSGAVTTEMLLRAGFFKVFVLNLTTDELAHFYSKYPEALQIVTGVCVSGVSGDSQFPVLQKFLTAAKYQQDIDVHGLIEFLSNIFDQQFSMNMVELLLSFIDQPHIMTLLTREMKKRPEAFQYFVKAGGFTCIDEFVGAHPKSAKSVMELLSALVQFSPHAEIDKWINTQPITSPIFNCSSGFLAQMALGFSTTNYILHVPSLLPFASDFDASSPLNLYLVGRYGVCASLRRNMSLYDIPHIEAVANRYVEPDVARELLHLDPSRISAFVNPAMPQFSLYEFVPLIRPGYLRFREALGSISFWFRVPKTSEGNVLIMTAGSLSLCMIGESLVFQTGCEQIALLASSEMWHHVVVRVHKGRTFMETDIDLDLKHFGPVKTTQEKLPSDIFFGDRVHALPVTLHLSKAIVINEKTFADAQVIELNKNGPSSMVNNSLYAERSDFVFDVRYLGFATYFRSPAQIENLFRIFERLKSNEQCKSVYTLILNLQKMHRVEHRMIWTRVLMALKRQIALVGNKILFYLFEYPSSLYGTKCLARVVFLVLDDIEFWFLFPADVVKTFLEKALNAKMDWNSLSKYGLLNTLLTMIRMEVGVSLAPAILALVTKLVSVNLTPDNLRSMLNVAMSLCDWEHTPVDLLRAPVPKSSVQELMLAQFLGLYKAGRFEKEVYTSTQLLDFALLFSDDRAFALMEAIVAASERKPKFAPSSMLMSYVFEMFGDDSRTWEYAFGILLGMSPIRGRPKNFKIQRPAFISIFINMMARNARCIAHGKLQGNKMSREVDRLRSVVDSLLTLDPSQISLFADPSLAPLLYNLTNLGITPNSYDDGVSQERVSRVWSAFSVNPTGPDEQQLMQALVTQHEAWSPPLLEDLMYDSEALKSTSFLYFPDETDEVKWMTDVVKSTKLVDFIARVVVSSPVGQFGTLLTSLVAGHASMYRKYSNYFGRELALNVLGRLSNPALVEHYKPAFLVLHSFAMCSLFSDCYMKFLRSILIFFRFMDASGSFEQFLSGDRVLKAYREILIAAFAFIPEGNSLKLYKLLSEYGPVVFLKQVFSDVETGMYWIHVTLQRGGEAPERIACMEHSMRLIDRTRLSSYSPSAIHTEWLQFKTERLKTGLDKSEHKKRVERSKQIIEGKQRKYSSAAHHELLSRIYRQMNVTNEKMIVDFRINLRVRALERSLYDIVIATERIECQDKSSWKSFRLSQVSLPMYQSRALSPSPFSLKIPSSGKKASNEFFALPYTPQKPRLPMVEARGSLVCSPEWCYFHVEGPPFSSPFEYSHVFGMSPKVLMALFHQSYADFGKFRHVSSVSIFHFIHSIPSVALISDSFLVLLVLAKTDEHGGLELITQPSSPVGFLPFTESVTLGEFSRTSLFCGHVVVLMRLDKIMKLRPYLYLHREVALSVYPVGGSNVVLVFSSNEEMELVEGMLSAKGQVLSKLLPPSLFYFNVPDVEKASVLWSYRVISSFDYLMILNVFGGRSFADLSQYPILPWCMSPQRDLRDLSMPMGQLGESRSLHFDQTYEMSTPQQYHYGFHYSLPGAVFWLLMRVSPFTFFQWDLNEGWDDSQRLFTSIIDAYQSASFSNPSDLKELLPQMYTTPEAFMNASRLELGDSAVRENVTLPEWTNGNPYLFMETSMKMLNSADGVNNWIDLIFGYKETGPAAIEAKNVFLPSSYHGSTADGLQMDEGSFTSQVLNFGQCPVQLFTEPHLVRLPNEILTVDKIPASAKSRSADILNPLCLQNFNCVPLRDKVLAIPCIADVIVLKYDRGWYFTPDCDSESVVIMDMENMRVVRRKFCVDFAFVSHVSVSSDGLFLSLSLDLGRVDIHQIIYDRGIPVDIHRVSSFSGRRRCTMSTILTNDLMCASLFGYELVMWNIATQMSHREIQLSFAPFAIHFDPFNAILTVVGATMIEQFTINGHRLHSLAADVAFSSFAFLPLDNTFDSRVLLVGRVDGSVVLVSVSSDDYSLRVSGELVIGTDPITSMYIHPTSFTLVTCDSGHVVITTRIETLSGSTYKCDLCDNKMSSVCAKCKRKICAVCRDDDVCRKCAKDVDFFPSLRRL